uniref:RRM domain-containing protein n=1 Tax=Macrostomum lignano TaxID=282301 RepID=A0A1I8I6C3_9PLAT
MSSRKRHVGDRDNPKASKCLGVFGLSLRTTEEDLRHLFGRYGRLEDVQLVKDNQHQAVARICLHDATYAKERCHGKELDGRNMRCDFFHNSPGAHSHAWRLSWRTRGAPSRGYGGGGGSRNYSDRAAAMAETGVTAVAAMVTMTTEAAAVSRRSRSRSYDRSDHRNRYG